VLVLSVGEVAADPALDCLPIFAKRLGHFVDALASFIDRGAHSFVGH
jgi:hypothetical protein